MDDEVNAALTRVATPRNGAGEVEVGARPAGGDTVDEFEDNPGSGKGDVVGECDDRALLLPPPVTSTSAMGLGAALSISTSAMGLGAANSTSISAMGLGCARGE